MRLYAAGSNGYGQLGLGHTEDVHEWTELEWGLGLKGTVQGSAGGNHLVLVVENEVYGTGLNSSGQLVPADAEGTLRASWSELRRLEIPALTGFGRIEIVAATWTHTAFLVSGRVYMQGCLRGEGTLAGWHATEGTQILNGGIHHLISSTSQGVLNCYGNGRHGEFGTGAVPEMKDEEAAVKMIACGLMHSVLLMSNGTVFTSGSDKWAQCGGTRTSGNGWTQLSMRKIDWVGATWHGTYLLSDDKRLYALGRNDHGQRGVPNPSMSDSSDLLGLQEIALCGEVKRVACGSEHVLVHVVVDGKDQVWGVGWNEHGNLGLGHTRDVLTPTCLFTSNKPIVNIIAGCGTSWIVCDECEEV